MKSIRERSSLVLVASTANTEANGNEQQKTGIGGRNNKPRTLNKNASNKAFSRDVGNSSLKQGSTLGVCHSTGRESTAKPKQHDNPVKPKPRQLTLSDLITTLPEVSKTSQQTRQHKEVTSPVPSHNKQPSPEILQVLQKPTPFVLAESAFPSLPSKSNDKSLIAKHKKTAHVSLKKESSPVKVPAIDAKMSVISKRSENQTVASLHTNCSDSHYTSTSVGFLNKKGRPKRLGPRKKKFTTLKKRVLLERLQKWKEFNASQNALNLPTTRSSARCIPDTASPDPELPSSVISTSSTIVCLVNFIDLETDDLTDEDEYREICADICRLAFSIGPVDGICIPRGNMESSLLGLVFVRFQNSIDALAARSCWKGMVLGGREINSLLISSDEELATKIFSSSASYGPKIAIHNILTEDDLTDDECMEETLSDIRHLIISRCLLQDIDVKVDTVYKDKLGIIADYPDNWDAAIATLIALDGTSFSGNAINTELFVDFRLMFWDTVEDQIPVPFPSSTETFIETSETHGEYDIVPGSMELWNILTEDDLQDLESLEECKEDILSVVKKFGSVVSLNVCMNGDRRGHVFISFEEGKDASIAAAALDGHSMFGGEKICASVVCSTGFGKSRIDFDAEAKPNTPPNDNLILVLSNVFCDDDLEDEENYEESKEDILALVSEFGDVSSMEVCRDGDCKGKAFIKFAQGKDAAVSAAKALNGKIIGGQQINAFVSVDLNKSMPHILASELTDSLNGVKLNGKNVHAELWCETYKSLESVSHFAMAPEKSNFDNGVLGETDGVNNTGDIAPEPILTKDGKLITARWAECKRVPKVQNSGLTPDYVRLLDDENTTSLLIEMLGTLMKFQQRSKNDANARARRRLVVGFREVARGVRAKKIKMVVMANNLDEYEVVGEKTQEIIDLCRASDIPILFELNKRKLGKALGKTLKMSIVGIQNADGAYEQFKKLKVILERSSNQSLDLGILP